MRRLLALVVLLCAFPAFPQSYPDVDALLDFVFAKDAATASSYFPVELLKSLQRYSDKDQFEFKQSLMLLDQLKGEDVEIVRSSQPPVLIAIHSKSDPEKPPTTINLEKRISDGYESVLRVRLVSPEKSSFLSDITALVWMRFEEGQWRFIEFQGTDSSDHIDLDDPKVIEEFRTHHSNANELTALTTLRQITDAISKYAAKYPDTGFPSSLEVLTCTDPKTPTSQGSCLLTLPFTNGPYDQNGYTFTYRPLLQSGPTRYFSVMVRPDTYGLSGTRSFFTDETGTLRYTEDDREPNVGDMPLQ